MSLPNPYETLGVTENASFEEIQEAKKQLTQKYKQDSKLLENLEAAYDAIIMERLRLRQEGKIKVPDPIRFAEKSPEAPSNFTPTPPKLPPVWLTRLVDTPSVSDILWPAGLFLTLGVLSILAPSATSNNFLSLLMAFGFSACVYFLNRKEQSFGRAMLITLLALVLGVTLGTVLANFLNNQHLGFLMGVDQFATLLTLFFFWLVSSFLR